MLKTKRTQDSSCSALSLREATSPEIVFFVLLSVEQVDADSSRLSRRASVLAFICGRGGIAGRAQRGSWPVGVHMLCCKCWHCVVTLPMDMLVDKKDDGQSDLKQAPQAEAVALSKGSDKNHGSNPRRQKRETTKNN